MESQASQNENLSKRKKVDVTAIIYVRNEEDIIEKNTDEVVKVLEGMGVSYEILGINVPSIDNSYKEVKKLGDKYDNYYPVNMVQVMADNLQKGYQIMLGCRLAKGKKVIIADSDGQVDPQDFAKVLAPLDEGFDVVFGWRKDRSGKHGFFYNMTSLFQNILSRVLTGMKIHDKNTGLKAMTDVAAKSLTLYGRNFRDMGFQLKLKGFKITEVPINWREREGGIQNFKFMDRLLGGTFDLVADVVVMKMMDKPFRFWGKIALAALIAGVVLIGSSPFLYMIDDLFGSSAILLGVVCWFGSMGSVLVGLLAEFIVSERKFDLDDYYIIDDPKGITRE